MSARVYQKICVIGDMYVGKTSLVRRFVQRQFDDTYTSTVGAQICRSAPLPALCAADPAMVLVIWDVAGGDTEQAQYHTYLEGASGALIVCDIHRWPTVELVLSYMQTFQRVNPLQPMVIVGNKSDLAQQAHALAHFDGIAAQLHTHWYHGSAKAGEQVDQAFHALANLIRISNQSIRNGGIDRGTGSATL